MARIKRDPPRIPTPEESARIGELEAESDRILDWIFDHAGEDNSGMVSRLGWIEKRILDIEGGRPLEVNEDFRR